MSDLPSAGHNWLASVAADIRALHAGIRRSAEQAARDAIEAGKLLIEAKQALEHGQWEQWLRDNCDLNARTARRYMALARSGLEIGHVSVLGLAGAARSITIDQLCQSRLARADRLAAKGWEHFVEAGRHYGAILDRIGEEQFRAWMAGKPDHYPDEALFMAEIARVTDAGGDLDTLFAREDHPDVFHFPPPLTAADIAELRARGLIEAPPP